MVARARWETAQRWYEVGPARELVGDWVLMRRWVAKLQAIRRTVPWGSGRRRGKAIY
jgi:hypothetical protein